MSKTHFAKDTFNRFLSFRGSRGNSWPITYEMPMLRLGFKFAALSLAGSVKYSPSVPALSPCQPT